MVWHLAWLGVIGWTAYGIHALYSYHLAEKTVGVVVDMESIDAQDFVGHCLYFRFTTINDETIVAREKWCSQSPAHEIGDKVELFYDPSHPQESARLDHSERNAARIMTFVLFYVPWLLMLGFTFNALVPYRDAERLDKRNQFRNHNGKTIFLRVTDVMWQGMDEEYDSIITLFSDCLQQAKLSSEDLVDLQSFCDLAKTAPQSELRRVLQASNIPPLFSKQRDAFVLMGKIASAAIADR